MHDLQAALQYPSPHTNYALVQEKEQGSMTKTFDWALFSERYKSNGQRGSKPTTPFLVTEAEYM